MLCVGCSLGSYLSSKKEEAKSYRWKGASREAGDCKNEFSVIFLIWGLVSGFC